MRIDVVVIAVAVATVAAAGPAAAKDSEEQRKKRARSFLEEGQAKYDLGKYDEAIDLFERSYEIWPYPEALYNLCQSHRQKKQFEKAIFYCKAYLRNDPASPRIPEVEQRVADMEASLAQSQQAQDQPPKAVEAPPGAEPADLDLEAPKPAGEPQPRNWTSWACVAGGVALLGVGTGLYLYGGSLHDDANATADDAEAKRLNDDATLLRTVGVTSGIAGAGLAAFGLHRLLRKGERRTRHATRTVIMGFGWIGVAGEF